MMAMMNGKAMSGEGWVPTVHIDLDKVTAKASREFRPGQMLRVVLVGTIESQSFRKPEDPEESGYEGSLCLKLRDVKLAESSKNAMAELLDDDE